MANQIWKAAYFSPGISLKRWRRGCSCGSEDMSPCCSSRGPHFSYQHSHRPLLTAQNSSFTGSSVLFWPPQEPACSVTCNCTDMYIYVNQNKILERENTWEVCDSWPYTSKSLHLSPPWCLPNFPSTSSPSRFQILRNKTHKGFHSFLPYFAFLPVVALLPATRPCHPRCRSYPSYWGQALKFRWVKATTNKAEAELCNVTPWSPGFRSKLRYYAIENFLFSC